MILPPSRPTQTPQVFTSLPVLWRACSTVCHFLLSTLHTKANSSYALPLLRAFLCFSVSAIMWNLASRLPSLVPFETPWDTFSRLLWTIFKLHGLKKLNSACAAHLSSRSLAAGAFDSVTFYSCDSSMCTPFPVQWSAKIHPDIN